MTIYTHLKKQDIEDLCYEFDLGRVNSWEPLSGGSENSNYTLTSEKGKYVISICEQKSEIEATHLAFLLEHLLKHKYNTSKVIRTRNDNPVLLWKSKPVLLKSYIEGNIIKELSPELLKFIGKELARLHKVPPPVHLPNQLNYGKESFKKVKEYAPSSSFDQWLESVHNYLSPFINLKLPRSLIHGDVFWNNIIISQDGNTVTIMDFEEAAYYFRVFDIGMTIIGTCAENKIINLKKAGDLLQGYQYIIPLSDDEIHSLKAFTIYAGSSMTFWRHINFNHVNPDQNLLNHYKGLQVLTEYVIEQEEDCFSRYLK